MSEPDKKPPAFHCPACGQKHRGDLSPLVGKPEATLKMTCVGCGAALAVQRLPDGSPRCLLATQLGTTAPAPAAPAPAPTSKPAASPPAAAPEAVKPAPTPASRAPQPKPAAPTPAPAPTPQPKAEPKPEPSPEAKPEVKAAPKSAPRPAPEATPRRQRDEERERVRGEEKAAAERREVKDPEFAAGTTLDRYRIEEAVGQGGTGTVYKAFDATTNRTVALKVLLKDQSEAMRQRFLREIEVQANIRHPNIMPVFDRGALPDGRPYFTMELLYSPFTLTEIVERRERGTLGRYATLAHLGRVERLVADVLVPVADAIHTANVENGVVHRDLKPDNVLVDSRTLRPYLIDFGICDVLERSGKLASGVVVPPTSEDAGIVGTPRFLAPEQARGSIHPRTDVWGLGALLHFTLTGEPPIQPASGVVRAEVQARVAALKKAREEALAADNERRVALCDEKLARLQDSGLRTLDDLFKDAREGRYVPLPDDAPAALAAVVRKAMAVEPANRYVNARQLSTELTAWVSGARVRAVSEAGGAVAAADTAKRAARRLVVPAVLALGAGALGFVLGGGAGQVTMLSSSADTSVLRDMIGAFEEQLNGVTLEAGEVVGAEATRLHRALERQAQGIADRIAREPKGAERTTLETQLIYQRRRIQPQRVLLAAPGAASWTAQLPIAGKTEVYKLQPGDDNLLAPGDYAVIGMQDSQVGPQERFRAPLRLPLRVRPAGVSADREAPAASISVPADPASIPEGQVLVLGGAVLVRQAPFAEPSVAPTDVRTFVLEREEVSNAEYAAFLASLPDAEAKERTPSGGFVLDPESGRMTVVRGGADVPVVGLRPDDARAYAAWKAKTDGKPWRLPTEAEWLLAAGAHMGWALPGGLRGTFLDGIFQPALDVAGKHEGDLGPHGERGLIGNAREMVEPSEAGVPVGSVLVKGAGVGDAPSDGLIYLMRPLGAKDRHPMTGLRLARAP